MKNNPNHGNRLRPVDDAYEAKKQRSRDRYAAIQLKLDPYWRHNKILKDLVNLYGEGIEIPVQEFDDRGFDPSVYKNISKQNSISYLYYNKHIITINKNKTVSIWKTSN